MKVNPIPLEISVARDSAPIPKGLEPKETASHAKKPILVEPTASHPAPTAAPQPVVNGLGLGLQFHVDKESGRSVIQVLDVESGEIVRQIPPEEVLTFLHQFDEGKGLILSRRL